MRRQSSSSRGRVGGREAAVVILAFSAVVALAGLTGCGAGNAPAFDPDSAFAYLVEQVDIGVRYPGSPGHRTIQRRLAGKLKAFGANVSLQPFEAVPAPGDTLRLVNIIGNYNLGARRRVLLGAHYDTRPIAEHDPDPANRDKPIPGANDGASGVAVLLEIARLLRDSTPPVGVDIVFFDGEDSGGEDQPLDYCLGSAHFARNLKGYRPEAAIIVDMVGKRDLVIPMEGYSLAAAPALLGELFDIAADLGIEQFRRERGPTIFDDHLPLIQAGIDAVVLIDFDYPYWHTLADTPDKCSPESLAAVGRVLLEFIWRR